MSSVPRAVDNIHRHSQRIRRSRPRSSNRDTPVLVDSQTVSDAEDEMEIGLIKDKLTALKTKAKEENHGNVKVDEAIVEVQNKLNEKLTERAVSSYKRNYEYLDGERSKSSIEQREAALKGITSVLAAKYDPQLYKHYDLEILHNAIAGAQSEDELTEALRAYILEAALNIDESCDFITSSTLPLLNRKLNDTADESSVNRAAYITAYSVLQYFIHVDNGGFGLDEKIEELVGVASESSVDKDNTVTLAALLGAALLLSASESRNFAIKQVLPEIVELLKDDDLHVRKTAGKLVALCYELYDFGTEQGMGTDNEQEFNGFAYTIPNVENNYLVSLLEGLINESSRSVPRREKQAHRSIFRKVLVTVEARLVPLGPRQAEYANISSGDYASDVISHLHFNSSKALPVLSWHQLLLSSALKWVYGDGLQNHVANNELIYSAIVEASTETLNFSSDAEYVTSNADPSAPIFGDPSGVRTVSSKQVDKEIRSNRYIKTREQLPGGIVG